MKSCFSEDADTVPGSGKRDRQYAAVIFQEGSKDRIGRRIKSKERKYVIKSGRGDFLAFFLYRSGENCIQTQEMIDLGSL